MKTLTHKFLATILVLSIAPWTNASDDTETLENYSGINEANIEKALISPSSEMEYNTAVELKEMIESSAIASQEAINAARSACYSSLTGLNNHSLALVPLPTNTVDLDIVCHVAVDPTWHAGGVAKGGYYDKDCTLLENVAHGGGQTSFTTEDYFSLNSVKYPSCGPTNAMICCSPQYPHPV